MEDEAAAQAAYDDMLMQSFVIRTTSTLSRETLETLAANTRSDASSDSNRSDFEYIQDWIDEVIDESLRGRAHSSELVLLGTSTNGRDTGNDAVP